MTSPVITRFGERALQLSWAEKIDPVIHDEVLAFEVFIHKTFGHTILETVATYQSLAIFFSRTSDLENCLKKLHGLIDTPTQEIRKKRNHWVIPVCYDINFGLDQSHVAQHNDCSIVEVISLHTQTTYRIYFTGFLPGFLYLGGLNEKLYTPRKKTPRLSVPAGAVAIGGNQTGIYPCESPGGWQIIGQTPIQLFNSNQSPPSPFQSGDDLTFKAISTDEFESICKKVVNGNYSLLNLKND